VSDTGFGCERHRKPPLSATKLAQQLLSGFTYHKCQYKPV